ncbi:MAG: YciI family protein [Micrococcales bacterium]|nr:YciI family protein [Micrococcales bacterium]
MAFFAITYTYAADPRIDELRPEHRAYLAALAEQGLLKASGPCPGTEPAQALLVLDVDSREVVESLLADDPFQSAGLVHQTDIVEWNPIIGVFAS